MAGFDRSRQLDIINNINFVVVIATRANCPERRRVRIIIFNFIQYVPATWTMFARTTLCRMGQYLIYIHTAYYIQHYIRHNHHVRTSMCCTFVCYNVCVCLSKDRILMIINCLDCNGISSCACTVCCSCIEIGAAVHKCNSII